jgi:hypothetical protein
MYGEKRVRVRVDYENNAEAFWDALRKHKPAVAAELSRYDEADVTVDTWKFIQELPGFSDQYAPPYAPHPLVEIGTWERLDRAGDSSDELEDSLAEDLAEYAALSVHPRVRSDGQEWTWCDKSYTWESTSAAGPALRTHDEMIRAVKFRGGRISVRRLWGRK